VHDEPEGASARYAGVETCELARHAGRVSFGVGARVQLDDRRAGFRARFDLRRVGVDEQRDADAVLRERSAGLGDAMLLPGHVEPAFGRELLAPFRYQAAVGRTVLDGELDHRVRDGHLEIQARLYRTQ